MNNTTMLNPVKTLMVLLGLACSFNAAALDFRSITTPKAILYDAPSTEATKLYILGQGYPVEVIVNLGEWIKVRDAMGGLSWVEGKQLSNKRTVLVLTTTEIKSAEDAGSSLVATAEKDVVLELLSSSTKSGWVKVKHRDGLTGYVSSTALWGSN
ncbi:MAG: SH3 domain-containing protein [Pseudomonadota bacterium]